MPGADTGRLGRSLHALTIGVVKEEREFHDRHRKDGLVEAEEQFQVKIKGKAEEEPEWDYIQLKFGVRFVDATGQRDSAFEQPHFTYGAEIQSQHPVGILAQVMKWHTNNKNETIGAKVAVGAVTNLRSQKFHGKLHVTFQGYTARLDSDMDVGDLP